MIVLRGRKGGKKTQDILAIIAAWNKDEEVSAQEVQKWLEEIDSMFETFRVNENLMAVLRDNNFSIEAKTGECMKEQKSFLSCGDRYITYAV